MKLLFERWQKFLNEEDVTKALDDELDQEGGAAGLDPLVAAAKKVDSDISEDEVEDELDDMKNVKQHKDGDYIDVAELNEEEMLEEKRKKRKKKKKKKKRDACYFKVKARYKVWPSAYASGALSKCRKKGAKNWGTGKKKKKK